MTLRNKVLLFLVSFVAFSIGNAVTHSAGPLSALINESTIAVAGALAPPAFGLLFTVWAVLAVATVYFATRDGVPTPRIAAISGAIVGFLVDGSWNLINLAVFPRWSVTLTAVDITWHVLHGAVVGLLIAWLARRWSAR